MKILSFKSGHDGTVAGADAARGQLLFSYEAEKDSHPRAAPVTPDTFIDAGLWFRELPDVLALSGWSGTGSTHATASGAGYFGTGPGSERIGKKTFFGKTLDYYSSTHERAHIWSAYALSPFPQGQPCYVLVWEGALGDFYEITADLEIRRLGRVMEAPGARFAALYGLADPAFQLPPGQQRRQDPGRLMAAAALGRNGAADTQEQALITHLLEAPLEQALDKVRLAASPLCNAGTQSQALRDLAVKLQDALFLRFHDFAARTLTKGYPLLISGGCGLNCGWNSRWRECGLFQDVFVPPCTGDSGCAIGTAADAMRHFTGRAKLDWSVYCGQPFLDDRAAMNGALNGARTEELKLETVAQALLEGKVIGWARGNCEIGPRALGNRSILAAPFEASMRVRLNRIKGRADDSPVAPACLEEDAARHFSGPLPAPHMLDFHQVTDPQLQAVTHADGSARLQTVSRTQNPAFHDLLTAFKAQSGTGVLCNTSLNFPDAGFINKTSDLCHYARSAGLDGFVAGTSCYWFG
ncbi:3-hydroxymethylcephem carbamoyltransferase (plasmid) [Leisingera sp. S132]|uniref:carbamoyltransferase C-terminal domain-containing protein n=1 Tax=Leisingera sp. S132 TaxID=2867016 RepID=UPI0021A38727|nr:carbamoyltransferase C-terminal domain-containing protein [Leisingera sp. S132]UWQ81900.1 3-hydroxymethylcephem carbamoyltransferase [Leisingera sp. S132]